MSDATQSIHEEAEFDLEVLQSTIPVLVDFWAPWCGPCRIVGPTIDRIATDFEGRARVVKVNVDEAPGIAGRYGIQSIPSIVLFDGGKPASGLIGAASYDSIAAMIEKSLQPVVTA